MLFGKKDCEIEHSRVAAVVVNLPEVFFEFFVEAFLRLNDAEVVEHLDVLLVVLHVGFQDETSLGLLAHGEEKVGVVDGTASEVGVVFNGLITTQIRVGS